MPTDTAQAPQDNSGHNLTDDETAAALGYITTLSEHSMAQEAPQSPETAPQAQQEQQPPEQPKDEISPKIDALESRIMEEMATLRDEIKASAPKDKDKEIEDLKKQIEDVLNQED